MRRKSPALFAPIAPMGLVALMGMGGAFWFVPTAIAPLSAQAYTARVDVSLDRQFGESYQTLLRRAEAIARAATQRSFDQDILVTDVSVMVLIQSEGAIAPILSLETTRQGWRSRPDPHNWITYYPTAESLLRLQGTTQLPTGQRGNSYYQPSSGYPVVPVPPATTNPNTQPSATPRRSNRGTPPQALPSPAQINND